MFYYSRLFDVIVVGGGHAGIEAAVAAAHIGCQVLLITHNINTIGQMSCNPAIGGIGKGHLVKEIDAMGGLMAQAIDKAGIHFRTLNASKGPAVRATRAQADRVLYRKMIRSYIDFLPNLTIIQQEVVDLILNKEHIAGIVAQNGVKFYSKSVILTVGTFLNSKIYIGTSCYSGGRLGDLSSILLSQRLRELSFRVSRLKTGTPPRIDKRSIDFSQLTIQYSDNPLPVFSFFGSVDQHPEQIPCYITYTNENTHNIVRQNLNLSPMYTGLIDGTGPRYCPSIEDKVMRFADRNAHQIFLELEGLTSNEVYPNGISTSLPINVQIKIIRSVKGLENARIVRPGYAIEYDFFDPRDLKLTLESKLIAGLFFAGQINGTTGYEEAAAQGMLAGINASMLANNKDAWVPRRDQAYLGVLVDDLCTLGTNEPYRMFTSRAEHRLLLREDNADLRLTEIAWQLGLVNEVRWKQFCIKQERIILERQRLRDTWIHPGSKIAEQINLMTKTPLTHTINGEELLRRPDINYTMLTTLDSFSSTINDSQIAEQIDIQIKYQGYIYRQKKEIALCMHNDHVLLPMNVDFNSISGLSKEVATKLNDYRPESINQASRIPGVTPVAISILLIWMKKQGLLN